MRRLAFSARALLDLEDIADTMSDYDPQFALDYVAGIERRALTAAERPLTFPSRDDIEPGLRAIPHRNHRILFRVSADEVTVMRVVHVRRNTAALWLD